MSTALTRAIPYVHSITRIVLGFLVLWHGLIKVFGFPAGQGDAVSLMSLAGVGGLIELIGGALLFLGLFTRPAALVVCAEMLITYIAVNLPRGFLTIKNDGESALAYAFFSLFLVTAGAGAFALDRLFKKRTAAETETGFASEHSDKTLGIMRVMVAAMFIQHGLGKYAGLFGTRVDHNWNTMRAWGGVLESYLPPLLAVGLFTRPIAFILSGEMAVVYWTRWASRGFWGSVMRGEDSIYFCFLFLLLFVAGGGAWALDNVVFRKHSQALTSVEMEEARSRV